MIRGTCAVKCRRASARGDLRRKEKYTETICGDNSEEETPVPIPNTEVKLLSADDTWWETAWESRTLPLILFWSYGQAVKTPPFHGGNPGSIPGRITRILPVSSEAGF